MRKFFKGLGIILGSLILLIIVILAGLSVYGQMSFKRPYPQRAVYPIQADTSPAGLQRGKYLMENVTGCANGCHSEGSQPFAGYQENMAFGPVRAVFAVPNLTPDQETGLGSWSDAEIARAIREGLDKDGVELVIMPAFTYHVLSDQDVAAMVGYLRALDPIVHRVDPFQSNTAGKIMLAMGAFGPRSLGTPITGPQESPQSGTLDYGAYLVSLGGCRDCHGQNLAGGRSGSPDSKQAPNLTPAGDLGGWTSDDFANTLRTGITPSGRQLDPEEMPWPSYGGMTDDDLNTIFLYLQSVPASPNNP